MKIALPTLIAAIVVAGFASTASTVAMEGPPHVLLKPQDIKWSTAPDVLPPGAEAALLWGDMSKKDATFVLRLKFPPGYSVGAHTHPVPEIVTVISGTFSKGMGDTVDPSKYVDYPRGSLIAMSPNTPHFVTFKEETVIQITTTGPWDLVYINPKDDPRKKTQ